MLDIPALIRSARKSAGLTQTQLADRVGCSLHAVWQVERGNGTVTLLNSILADLTVRFVGLPPGRTIPERLRLARTRRGLGQKNLAERANVSPMALYRLERGNARIATLVAVLRVLAPQARAAGDRGVTWRKV